MATYPCEERREAKAGHNTKKHAGNIVVMP